MDFFSAEGFQKCHASGKRKQHHPLKVQQCVCSVFPHELAVYEVNGQYFSERGYEGALQRNPGLRHVHCRVLSLYCSEYPDRPAEVLCEDCCDLFSVEAFLERHGHGHRQRHSQLALDNMGRLHRFGQPLPPEEKGVGKAQMEDRMIIRAGIPVEYVGANCKKVVVSLFGVFDGHSGASCSDFVATNLDRIVFECIRHQTKREVGSDMAIRSALQAAFRTTEHNFFQYANRLEAGPAAAWANAGSTACTCTFYGPDEDGRLRLAVANAGDSRAVLGRKDCRAIRLSEDHTPDVPGERKRIESEGAARAVVQASGIWRIVLPSKKGTGLAGLSVSRGFGDIEYKTGTNAGPDVFVSNLDLQQDCFVVIASDGVWGPVTDGEAVRIVASVLREGGEEPAANAARVLLEIAHQRDGHDDKTVLVIWFGDLPSAPPAVPISAHCSLVFFLDCELCRTR
ncbi:unnamed protein product [Effrenium voratum]|nr:unnamed protein product [Effrenium voratum]